MGIEFRKAGFVFLYGRKYLTGGKMRVEEVFSYFRKACVGIICQMLAESDVGLYFLRNHLK